MKPQDFIFLFVLGFLFWKRNPKHFVIAGLFCLLLSIPLFQFWIFFTAERLVYYAAGFFLIAAILSLKK